MRFDALTHILEGTPTGDLNNHFSQLATDSRLIQDPVITLFFAISGSHHDGHQFITELYQAGVRQFVIESKIDVRSYPGAGFFQVQSSVTALQTLAQTHRKQLHFPVVGITGSNGKTTVKEWLSTLLSSHYEVVKSPKSYNSQIGVPLSVWQAKEEHTIGVFEAGISQPGEMGKLARIIQPTFGIFTHLGPAHDEGFENRDQKLEEKFRLFENCDRVICRWDQSVVCDKMLAQYPGKIFSWSTESDAADLYFQRVEGLYEAQYSVRKYRINIPFAVESLIENCLHAITASILLGLDEQEIQAGVNLLRPVGMRLELMDGIHGCVLINDTYNNDLHGLKVALDFMIMQRQKQRKTVVITDFVESGQPAATLYAEVNTLLKNYGIDRIVGIGPEISSNQGLFEIENVFYRSTKDFIHALPEFREEMILLKGARKFALEKSLQVLQARSHKTVLEVNFESLVHNLNQYRKLIDNGTKIMAMVKAFAYGGGIREIANLLQFHKIHYLGVAFSDEGIALRNNGVHTPIMIMNPAEDDFELLRQYDLEPEIFNLSGLHRVHGLTNPPKIHLKIETGMNRLGFSEEDIPELLETLSSSPLHVASVFTHFSSAEIEQEDDFTRQQAIRFEQVYEQIIEVLGYKPIRHVLNSAGIVRWPGYHYEMVRLGIGLYGHDASGKLKLKPASKLKSYISQIKHVKKGESIGYGRSGKAAEEMNIAILPIGYADGYLRAFGNGVGHVKVGHQEARTVGNICMDMTMVDISGLDVVEGAEVVLFGKDPRIEDLAKWADTIPYEILTHVSTRVNRQFISE